MSSARTSSNDVDRSPSVLIVEDEILVAEDLESMLERMEYEVTDIVTTGEEALRGFDEEAPDLILLDIMLDGELDGIDVAEEINVTPSPVIYVTAHSDQNTLDTAKKTDPLGYLTKPINEADLRTTMEVAIERKGTLKELRRTKNKYQSLFNQSLHGLLQVNEEGIIEQANETITDILGYSREELAGMSVESLIPSRFRDTHSEDRRSYMESPEARPIGQGRDLVALHKDGTEVPVEIGLNSIEMDDGLVIIVDLTDISARKEAEQELLLKERAMANANDGIIITEPRGTDNPILYANQGFLDTTGYELKDVLGRDCRFLQGPETDPETVSEINNALEAGESITIEILNYRKNGEPFWNQLSITPVTNDEGEITNHIGIQTDVTERIKHEKKLDLRNRALNSATEGITITKAGDGGDDPIIYVNQGFLDLVGYDREEVIGRDCRFMQGPETDEQTVDQIRDALRNEDPVTVEIRNYSKNGEQFWNRLSITPIRDSDGEVTHYIGIQQDITDYKAQEKKLRQSEKLAAIGEMAAGLMHEINNPNAFIQGNVEFIQKAWNKIENRLDLINDEELKFVVEEFDETINAIKNGTERIENIVDKVKLFSRRKTDDEEFEAFNPTSVIEDALDMIRHPLRQALSVDLEASHSGQDYLIRASTSELKQVVTNLVENALDAVEGCDDPEVKVLANIEDSKFRLIVEDNGMGIPEEQANEIFNPFFTTKKTGEGTGLGLSIVNGIIDRTDGEIRLNSSEGEGTRFIVEFPLVDDDGR